MHKMVQPCVAIDGIYIIALAWPHLVAYSSLPGFVIKM